MNKKHLPKFAMLKSGFSKLCVLLLIICLGLTFVGCENKIVTSYDFETYLGGDTEFESDAAMVLPSKEDLADSKIIHYMYYADDERFLANGDHMLRLTVEYSDENFEQETQRMQTFFEEYIGKNEIIVAQGYSSFYYAGAIYNGFEYYATAGHCAFAYHSCSDTKTISYIAFTNDLGSSMSVPHALEQMISYMPDDEIIPYK